MTAIDEPWTLGVEEEYQIIDPTTRALRPEQERILPRARRSLGDAVQPELQLSQIEVATPVCATLADVRATLVASRRGLIAAAEAAGRAIAAAGTHPFSHWDEQPLTPKERYRTILDDYQQLAREQVIFGCHVHVGLRDREAALHVLNHARVWLAPLLALAANSPFWLGADTGYASFRSEIWGRWPMAGPPQPFASRAEYDALVADLVASGSIEDASKIYWDMRLPERVDTVEVRVTDVCLSVDEAVMIAGLARALVRTCYERALRDEPPPRARPELVRIAHWRAARYGLDDTLLDLEQMRPVPAPALVEKLVGFLRPALEAAGDWHEVAEIVARTLRDGNGAARQRAAYRRAGRLDDVVDLVVAETRRGVEGSVALVPPLR